MTRRVYVTQAQSDAARLLVQRGNQDPAVQQIADAVAPNVYEWRRPDGVRLMQYLVAPHLDLNRGWFPAVLHNEREVHCFRRTPNGRWELKAIWNKAGVES